LCAALVSFGTKIGVIYADNPEAGAFSEDNQKQFACIARLASVGFEPTQYVEWLEGEHQFLKNEIAIQHEMIGESPKTLEVYERIRKVAPTDSTVLIAGPSGTGKELAARAIHGNSSRANRAFVAVNCGAIPKELIGSEVFGHEKGAFTGAVSQHKGRIERAEGGTLFLDEIGELPAGAQALLLRVLQEREFERLGGTKTIKANVRIIAATNRNLRHAIKDGCFREDLYFRLNVFSIMMPPLSDRHEDIPALTDHFVRKFGPARGISGVAPDTMRLIQSYNWPGNVRQLANAIEHACILAEPNLIRVADLPEELRECAAPISADGRSFHDQVNDSKRTIIETALSQTDGHHASAAKLLDLDLSYLYTLVRTLGISRKPERPS
jgi:DNA-binding NtrC family response regulator